METKTIAEPSAESRNPDLLREYFMNAWLIAQSLEICDSHNFPDAQPELKPAPQIQASVPDAMAA